MRTITLDYPSTTTRPPVVFKFSTSAVLLPKLHPLTTCLAQSSNTFPSLYHFNANQLILSKLNLINDPTVVVGRWLRRRSRASGTAVYPEDPAGGGKWMTLLCMLPVNHQGCSMTKQSGQPYGISRTPYLPQLLYCIGDSSIDIQIYSQVLICLTETIC